MAPVYLLSGYFLTVPFLFRYVAIKHILTWWYHRKIRQNEAKAEKLKREKSEVLQKVMETETYKVAKL